MTDIVDITDSIDSGKPPCRHEYIKIYQRRLKGLDRRLVATRAYLPVGFKMVDLKHLSEGSFCFCTKCRKRLFPKRTTAEKEEARIERKREKDEKERTQFMEELRGMEDEEDYLADDPIDKEIDIDGDIGSDVEADDAENAEVSVAINVDELEVESVDFADIKAEGVKLSGEEELDRSCDSTD